MTSEIVALLLGDEMPPARLGELLRDGRKRAGLKRTQAAKRVGITADVLRNYERGTATISAEVCTALADLYGEDLTAHVPLRAEAPLDDQILDRGSADDVVAAYVELLRRVRGTKAGDPLPLRATDLAAISVALEADPAFIEQRIMDTLGCSRKVARTLHRELLRRRVLLPVAGLAASVTALAGVAAAQAATGSPAPTTNTTVPAAVAAAPTTTIAVATPTTVVPHSQLTPPTTTAPPAKPIVIQRPAPAPVVHENAPLPAPAAAAGDGDTPVGILPGEHPITPPSIPEDDTPVGVLPGEHPQSPPTTIRIGTAIQAQREDEVPQPG
jgi:transcriptional regulator with XRE-family HTH domain